VLRCALRGLHALRRGSPFELPPGHRLGFRELGLAIGLRAVAPMSALSEAMDDRGSVGGYLDALGGFVPLAERIEHFWLDPAHRATPTWAAHRDINEVMLATSLSPDGWFGIGSAGR
jgi:hypothetical protein